MHVVYTGPDERSRGEVHNPVARVAELRELCRTAGLQVLDVITQRGPSLIRGRCWQRQARRSGAARAAMQYDATVLIFDPELTPAQARTISDATTLGSSIERC